MGSVETESGEGFFGGMMSSFEGGRFVKVNCCCPGYCATDMSSHRGHRSAEDGARNAVILALQGGGQGALTGEFIQDYQVGSW